MRLNQKSSLTVQIVIALLLAVVLLRHHAVLVDTYIKPVGVIFLNLLKFIVAPLVLFSIMAGILSMNDVKKDGRTGLRALLYFMATPNFKLEVQHMVKKNAEINRHNPGKMECFL